jgi:5,10-methenyltetrahydrofolate synthetase
MPPLDLSEWRKQERRRLLQARQALSPEQLDALRARMDMHVQRAFPELVHGVTAFCWPYRGEYDARHLIAQLRRFGGTAALPVVLAPNTPLIFRQWDPAASMEKGPLGIPFPKDTPEVAPDHVLLPVVGWDAGGYRLGYGGGFFDRTLAGLARRPRVIGTGYELQSLETIHPQPHDMPVDFMVTERGVYRREPQGLRFLEETGSFSSPVCYAGEIAPDYFGEPKPG